MGINRSKYYEWASNNGFIVSNVMANLIFNGLEEKKKRFGVAYCPCVPPYAHTINTICPCVPCKNKLSPNKECHCGLFAWK